MYESDVKIKNLITTNPEKTKAISNKLRAKILNILAQEEKTIKQIQKELKKRKEKKAETTIRHHIKKLRDAGMVEISKIEEVNGGTLKYYKSNTLVHPHKLPKTAKEKLDDLEQTIEIEISKMIRKIESEHEKEIREVANEMKPCEYCTTEDYEKYIIRKLIKKVLLQKTK